MWAKIVNNEIMQTWDDDPTGLWHPDAIEKNDIPGYWEEIPDHVNIGWKFKNDEWIPGGQWHDEFMEENPIPPPGPPTARISQSITVDTVTGIATVIFDAASAGFVDSIEWEIDGKTYTDEHIMLEFTQDLTARQIAVSLTAEGPGGIHTDVLEDETALIIPEKFVPLFVQYLQQPTATK